MFSKFIIIFAILMITKAIPIKQEENHVNIGFIEKKLVMLNETITNMRDDYTKIIFGASYSQQKSILNGSYHVHEATEYIEHEDEELEEASNIVRAHVLFQRLRFYSQMIYEDWNNTPTVKENEIVLKFWGEIVSYLYHIETELDSKNVAKQPPRFQGYYFSRRDIRDFVVLRHIYHYTKHYLKFLPCLTSVSANKFYLIQCR